MSRGIIKSSTGILGKDYSEVSEQNNTTTREANLRKEISRLSFLVGSKATSTDDITSMLNFNAALALLSQAQTLVGNDNREATKILSLARRLSR